MATPLSAGPGPLSAEVAALFAVPNVAVPVPAAGQQVVYVPTLGLRPEASMVVGILQMLVEHGLDESTFVNVDGSIKDWKDWSKEDRWEMWEVLQKVRQSLSGGIGDFLKSQVPGFDASPRHRLAQESGWHLHNQVGETCLETVIRPWLDDRHPVSAMSLALPGDFVSVLSRDAQSPDGVRLSSVAVGQYSPVPFGKTVIDDDLLSSAKERSAQLRRLLNVGSGRLPFSLSFQAVIIPNEVPAAPAAAAAGPPSGGGGATWFEPETALPGGQPVSEEHLIDPTAGPEQLLKAVTTILLDEGLEKVDQISQMMRVFKMVRQALVADSDAFADRASQSQAPASVWDSDAFGSRVGQSPSSSSTGSPSRRQGSRPGTPMAGVPEGL